MSASATPTGEPITYVEKPQVVDVTSADGVTPTHTSGQRFRSGMEKLFSGHKSMGSDGLAEIVTIHMSRDEASELESSLSRRITALRERRLAAR